jgi:hypothetical protein
VGLVVEQGRVAEQERSHAEEAQQRVEQEQPRAEQVERALQEATVVEFGVDGGAGGRSFEVDGGASAGD